MSSRRGRDYVGYAVAVGSVALILLLRLRFFPFSGHQFLMLLSAVMASAWFGGFGPGLLATLLGGIGTDFFLIPPYHSVMTGNSWPVVVFVIEGGIISALAEVMRRAREKAHRAVSATEDVMAILAHDLRNPLNAVIGYASLLREMAAESPGSPVDPSMLEAIERSGKAMSRLITDVLDSARIDGGGLAIERTRTNVLTVCRSVKEMLAFQAKGKRLEVIADGEEDRYTGSFDQGRLLQLFLNLVSNALKFTPPGGSVTIRLAATTSMIRVNVTDTGPGVAANDIPRLFDRHWQGKKTPRAPDSLGLGLYIAKGICDAHGGRIGVKSREGEGSTFWVELPREPGQPSRAFWRFPAKAGPVGNP
jgi:signal transduction histidine kinase